MNHTPGPWTPYIGEECHGVLGPDGRHILEFWNRHEQDNVANAHLVASAPELLEALVEMVEAVKSVREMNHHRFDALGVKVNNLIAKATGQPKP
jgi:hypothetical protein